MASFDRTIHPDDLKSLDDSLQERAGDSFQTGHRPTLAGRVAKVALIVLVTVMLIDFLNFDARHARSKSTIYHVFYEGSAPGN